MKAHVVKNGVVINTIEVESLDFIPGLVEATIGCIGWTWDGKNLSPAVPNSEAQWAVIRADRNARLADSDWTQLPDSPVSAATWTTYRQALRDITTQDDPFNIIWPVAPA